MQILKIKRISIFVSLLLCCCTSNSQQCGPELEKILQDKIYKYEKTFDNSQLEVAFEALNDCNKFKRDRKLDGFYEGGKKLLLLMGKFDLALEVIGNSEIDQFTKEFDLNFMRFMKAKSANPVIAKEYLNKLDSLSYGKMNTDPRNLDAICLYVMTCAISEGKESSYQVIEKLIGDPRFEWVDQQYLERLVEKIPKNYYLNNP